MTSLVSAENLRTSFKSKRSDWGESLRVRVHRAISWLESAEKYSEDNDIALMSLMIGVHSCYLVNDFGFNQSQKMASDNWSQFIINLRGTRELKKIQSIIFSQQGLGFLKAVAPNVYLAPDTYRSGLDAGQAQIEKTSSRLESFIRRRDTEKILSSYFYSLNLLRNVIAHGSRTYDSQLNAEAVEQGKLFLFQVLPMMIQAMIENPKTDWGEIEFPVVR